MESADWFNVSEAMSRNTIVLAIKILAIILVGIVTGAVIIPLVNKYYRNPRGKKPIAGAEAFLPHSKQWLSWVLCTWRRNAVLGSRSGKYQGLSWSL